MAQKKNFQYHLIQQMFNNNIQTTRTSISIDSNKIFPSPVGCNKIQKLIQNQKQEKMNIQIEVTQNTGIDINDNNQEDRKNRLKKNICNTNSIKVNTIKLKTNISDLKIEQIDQTTSSSTINQQKQQENSKRSFYEKFLKINEHEKLNCQNRNQNNKSFEIFSHLIKKIPKNNQQQESPNFQTQQEKINQLEKQLLEKENLLAGLKDQFSKCQNDLQNETQQKVIQEEENKRLKEILNLKQIEIDQLQGKNNTFLQVIQTIQATISQVSDKPVQILVKQI
ncbi:unnamed protein product [Paramecium sonneborni]|uniref:Uncharacterized protein n=1 Tax=Paramecium sonneborni TaxID=65129 RepID=A0A8S1LM52_9CILI|nr:unnamed protein product [Paramecium sonneborni]